MIPKSAGGGSSGNAPTLLIEGNASIDGVLNVELLGNFTPTQGDEFPVITAGTRDGEFDTIDGIQVAADRCRWTRRSIPCNGAGREVLPR